MVSSIRQNSSVLLYRQVYNALLSQIKNGEIKEGEQIPPENKLTEIYQCSRITIRSAIQKLVEEGILVKRQGKGTYVARHIFVETMAGGSFSKSCLQSGRVPTTRMISMQTLQLPNMELILGTPDVIRIQRLRYTDEVATILEEDYFRQSDSYIQTADLTNQPIADTIRQNTGHQPEQFEDTFDITLATTAMAELLSCNERTPLLTVRQLVMAEDRQVLYYNEQFILAEQYKYRVSYS